MKEEYVVSVTEEDFQRGVRRCALSCPVALAVKRATGFDRVTVGERNVIFGNEAKYARIPERISNLIHKFDAGQPVSPETFSIKVLSDWGEYYID